MQNSIQQEKNAFDSFQLRPGTDLPEKVLLVDDLVDSRWTFTACGYYLTEDKRCSEVYPFALADTSEED